MKASDFNAKYYDKNYFVTPEGKKFHNADGKELGWSYNNPEGEFLGAGPIAQAWATIFKPKNMLDVGCGRGTFVAYARKAGIEAHGFDFSEFATSEEGKYAGCEKGWLKCHDASKPWPYPDNHFDLVTCLDLFEHIYEEDLPQVINEMFRVAKKWVFIQICTVNGQEGYTLGKKESVPIELEGMAVAGHVCIKPEYWWNYRFYKNEWLPRKVMTERFISLVDNNIISNWIRNSILVFEKDIDGSGE